MYVFVCTSVLSDQFSTRNVGKLPDYNTRIKLPEDERLDPFDGELESTHTYRAA